MKIKLKKKMRVFVIGKKEEKPLFNLPVTDQETEFTYFDENYSAVELMRFAPDIIFDAKKENVLECYKW